MKIFYVILFILCFSVAQAEVIFQDNFDDHADWSPTQPATGGSLSSQDGDDSSPCTGCPDGTSVYAGYRVARTSFTGGRVGNNTINITSANARGGTGKAFTLWTSPIDDSLSEGWNDDGLLVVDLGANYDTVYVRYYIKFDPTWIWDDDETGRIKMAHFQHYVGTGEYWDYFLNGDNWPAAVPNFVVEYDGGVVQWGGDAVYRLHMRKQSCYYPEDGFNDMPGATSNDYFRYGIPTAPDVNCTLGTDCVTWQESLFDGEWHVVENKMQGNSAIGVSDGEWLVYIDGDLAISKTNIPWGDLGELENGSIPCSDTSGGVIDPPADFGGWNMIILGGNSLIERYANTADVSVEQFYAIDDLVISTTYVGPDAPGESSEIGPGDSSKFTLGDSTVIN